MEKYELTDYAGINYAPGQITNMDPETGVRYGVIPHGHVGTAWYEDSEPHYGEPVCPECGNNVVEYEDKYVAYEVEPISGWDYACENCEIIVDAQDAYPDEPLSFCYDRDGYRAEQIDEVDIFISKSPYYTYAQFCSPCAPGACYLPSPLDHKNPNNRCYCFGPEWFDDEKAPYPVYYRVKG